MLVIGAELPGAWGGGRLKMNQLSIPIDPEDTVWVYASFQVMIGAVWKLLSQVDAAEFTRGRVKERIRDSPASKNISEQETDFVIEQILWHMSERQN